MRLGGVHDMEFCEKVGVSRKDGGQSCFLPERSQTSLRPMEGHDPLPCLPAAASVMRYTQWAGGKGGSINTGVGMGMEDRSAQDQRLLTLKLDLQGLAARVMVLQTQK